VRHLFLAVLFLLGLLLLLSWESGNLSTTIHPLAVYLNGNKVPWPAILSEQQLIESSAAKISHKYIPISHNSSISHSAILVSHQAINRAVNYLFQPSAYNFSRPVYLPSPINSSPKLLNYSFFNSCSSHNSYLSVLQLSNSYHRGQQDHCAVSL